MFEYRHLTLKQFHGLCDANHILEICIAPDNPERFLRMDQGFRPGDEHGTNGYGVEVKAPGYAVLVYVKPALHVTHPTMPDKYAHAIHPNVEFGIILN